MAIKSTRKPHCEQTTMIKTTIAAVAFIVAGITASAAQAHGKIVASEPKAGGELQAGPKEIRLRFNEALESAFSKIALVDAREAAIALSGITVDKNDPKVIFAQVPALKPGQYRVRWTAMTHDGHKTKGEFGFKVE
jgi:methionine-rich copper-binding protein CopC